MVLPPLLPTPGLTALWMTKFHAMNHGCASGSKARSVILCRPSKQETKWRSSSIWRHALWTTMSTRASRHASRRSFPLDRCTPPLAVINLRKRAHVLPLRSTSTFNCRQMATRLHIRFESKAVPNGGLQLLWEQRLWPRRYEDSKILHVSACA